MNDEHKGKQMTRKTKRSISIWVLCVSAILLITGVFAAYTRGDYVKRVVASKNETANIFFSSNYLYPREMSSAEAPLRMISVSSESDISVTVTVCNYNQDDLTKVNEESITYTLTAALVDADGKSVTDSELLSSLRISSNSFSAGGTYSKNSTLTGGAASADFYEITCGKEYASRLENIFILIQATPKSGSQKLVARLNLGSGAMRTTPWSGKFAEVTDDNQDTTNLDGFNYVISGTESATVSLKWNPEKVTLSKWSTEQFDAEDIEKGDSYIRIKVGEKGTSYTLQFYRVNGIPAGEKGSDVRGYVTFSEATVN